MKITNIPQAWYTECLLNESNAALIPDIEVLIDQFKVIQLRRLVDGSIDEPLYMRYTSTPFGDFVGGQGHASGECIVNKVGNNSWSVIGPTFGISPVAFNDNKLYVVRNGDTVDVYDLSNFALLETIRQPIGTQGIRYFTSDGKIVSGDSTYDGRKLPWNLAEWTALSGSPNYVVGQGYNGGAIIWNESNGERRVLESGNTTWIRAHRNGDNLAIAIVKQTEHRAVAINCTVAELINFPIENTPIPPDPNMPPFPPDLSSQLENVKNRLIVNGEDLSGPNAGKITRQFAYENIPGFALLSKPSGSNFEGCSTDILLYGTPDNYSIGDVLGDAGGANNIQWGFRAPDDSEKGRWVSVLNDPGYFNDGPIPPDPPPSNDLQKQINELKAENARQQAEIDSLKQQSEDIIHAGDNVAIQSISSEEHQQYMRYDWGDRLAKFDRNSAGIGETYRLEKK